MARRIINSEINEDEKYISLSHTERLLWIGLILSADNLGRGKADIQSLKIKSFPYNHITLAKVEKIRQKVEKKMNKGTKSVKFYSKNLQKYYQLLNWEEYQYIRKDRERTSKIPSFKSKSVNPVGNQKRTMAGQWENRVNVEESRVEENRIEETSDSFNNFKNEKKGFKKWDYKENT